MTDKSGTAPHGYLSYEEGEIISTDGIDDIPQGSIREFAVSMIIILFLTLVSDRFMESPKSERKNWM